MTFQLIHVKSLPIFKQLQLEEALLRSDGGNWCLINEGSTPAIVMGISGKKEELIDSEKAAEQNIPVIKRFSGGGTVIVDEQTLFITFICQKNLLDFPAYPEPIMRWTETIYRDALAHPEFKLRENDYVIGNRKFGGNAQYIRKDRWLHHSSLLWDFSPQRMELLLHPKKTPPYRQGRSHLDFLCRLSDFFSEKEDLVFKVIASLKERFDVRVSSLEEAWEKAGIDHRKATCLLGE